MMHYGGTLGLYERSLDEQARALALTEVEAEDRLEVAKERHRARGG